MTPEQAAYKAMQDAVAAGKNELDTLKAGAMAVWHFRKGDTVKNVALARDVYDKHFKVMGPN